MIGADFRRAPALGCTPGTMRTRHWLFVGRGGCPLGRTDESGLSRPSYSRAAIWRWQMAANPPVGIDLVQLVTIPTMDQARSLAFYVSLGFEIRADFPWADGHRWIEVYPPGAATGLSLVPAGPDPVGVRTGIILNTHDIGAAHARMKALGIDVDPAIAQVGSAVTARIGAVEKAEPEPPMFWFRDPDGNELLLVQPHLT
jgi:catechol 2,3-dioxygenase-like lactoylglutathione lyase family enzyme